MDAKMQKQIVIDLTGLQEEWQVTTSRLRTLLRDDPSAFACLLKTDVEFLGQMGPEETEAILTLATRVAMAEIAKEYVQKVAEVLADDFAEESYNPAEARFIASVLLRRGQQQSS